METLIYPIWGAVKEKRRLGATIVSELKCCKRCGAFTTCTTKGECCPECEWFDPIDNLCMAIPETKKAKSMKRDDAKEEAETVEVDPDTFLFEDDDEEEDDRDLPPERESKDEDSLGLDDDDW